jgi:hypothetical protein
MASEDISSYKHYWIAVSATLLSPDWKLGKTTISTKKKRGKGGKRDSDWSDSRGKILGSCKFKL